MLKNLRTPRPDFPTPQLHGAVVVSGGRVAEWEARCIEALNETVASLAILSVGESKLRMPALVKGDPFRETALRNVRTILRDLNELKRREVDFVLDLSGELSDHGTVKPRFGIWSFRTVDGRNRIERSAYWRAFVAGSHTFDVALVAHKTPGGDRTLRSGRFRLLLGSKGLRSAVSICSKWAAWSAQELSCVGASINRFAKWKSARPPALHARLRGQARALRRVGVSALELSFANYNWNVGVVDAGPEALLGRRDTHPIRWLQWNSRALYADPMVLKKDGRAFVFCEAIDPQSGRGRIETFALDGPSPTTPSCIMEGDLHFSYPYVFEHCNAQYLIPECAESREVRLYAATAFPHAWTPVATLISDFDACDSTVFRYGERWWMFCTAKESNPNLQLFAFYADDLRGPWRAHVRNPIKTDVTSARSAGPPFRYAGHLYRPAQDCSDTYGGAICINRIDFLSPSQFEETTIQKLTARDFGFRAAGVHTLSHAQNVCLIDAKYRRFSLWRFRNALRPAPARPTNLARAHG